MELIDMKHSPEEREEESVEYQENEGPDYPFGLKITLGEDELEKLGINKNPKTGEEFMLHAKCHVCSESESSYDDGDEHRNVTLQITKMDLIDEEEEEEEDEQEKADRIYARRRA